MELNEAQINRLLAIIDSKVAQAVATQLSALIPDHQRQQATAFEQIFMQGYTVGAPLQQGTFREFLRRCRYDELSVWGSNDITVTFDSATGKYTVSGLTLKNAIEDLEDAVAALPTCSVKTITDGTNTITNDKDSEIILDSDNGISVVVNGSTGEISIQLEIISTTYGGKNLVSYLPTRVPLIEDELIADSEFQTKIVVINNASTASIDFGSIGFPKTEFVIVCNDDLDITSDLASANINAWQNTVSFTNGNIYRLVIYRVYDVSASTTKYYAYAEKIEL